MRLRAGFPALALLLLSTAHGPVEAEARATREVFLWEGRLEPGQVLEVKGVNGSVRAESTDDGEAEVVATKRGRRNDPSEVEIKVVEHSRGVTLCAIYPGRRNECQPGSRGRLGADRNDVKVDFEVLVPEGVRFAGHTINGAVKATSLSADVEAYTVNGGVEVETHGTARAETVNGCISASLGASRWEGPVTLETINGSVTVKLPADVSADVSAKTTNGKVSSDFELEVSKSKYLPGRKAWGKLGGGGGSLKVKTVNGSITLLRSR